jgi:hypothetical protein
LNHNLAGVTWVGQSFLIAGHAGAENNLPQGLAFGSVTVTGENFSIF